MINNPFFYGNPVSLVDFCNRREPLRRVVGRLSRGESTAIIGLPRIGKTSLLQYIGAPENRSELYGTEGEKILFRFLDTQALGSQSTPAQFWELALEPVKEHLVDPDPDSAIAKQYNLCYANQFGNFTLEKLFASLSHANWRLVLLLDEFHLLLDKVIIVNRAEFFGGMRMLASRSKALALVVASRYPLSVLDAEAQAIYPSSSFFNIFNEFTLGTFPESDALTVLEKAKDRFISWDTRGIREIAGRHPFLLQAAAAAMWNAYEDGLLGDTPEKITERRRMIGQSLYRENKWFFADIWRVWSAAMRKAFTTIAMAHTDHLLPGREFLTDAFVNGLNDLAPELDDLKVAGLVTSDEQVRGGWRIVPQVMVWWLADELVRIVRDNKSFEDWFRGQELKFLLTKEERDLLVKAAEILGQGGITFIENFAQGLGQGIGKSLTGGDG